MPGLQESPLLRPACPGEAISALVSDVRLARRSDAARPPVDVTVRDRHVERVMVAVALRKVLGAARARRPARRGGGGGGAPRGGLGRPRGGGGARGCRRPRSPGAP